MDFRRHTTFNKNDSNYRSENGRYVIDHNVPRRCEEVLRRIVKSGRKGISLSNLVEKVNAEYQNEYSESDIHYAVTRLRREAIVYYDGSTYVANESAQKVWRKIKAEAGW
jgi:hypothetical protein